jgi:hypothetical protein
MQQRSSGSRNDPDKYELIFFMSRRSGFVMSQRKFICVVLLGLAVIVVIAFVGFELLP